MKPINLTNFPKSNGHYSHCIEHNGILYLSGQLPISITDGSIPRDIKSQTEIVLNRIAHILEEAKSSKYNIIQMRLYIADINLWDEIDFVYSQFFGTHKPVRSIIPVNTLHYGSLIEAEATAFINC